MKTDNLDLYRFCIVLASTSFSDCKPATTLNVAFYVANEFKGVNIFFSP